MPCVDDSRLRSPEVERRPIAADQDDAVASDGHRFSGGLPRLRGGVDLRVVNDDGRGFGRWARLTRHERRREDGEDESSHRTRSLDGPNSSKTSQRFSSKATAPRPSTKLGTALSNVEGRRRGKTTRWLAKRSALTCLRV